VSAGTTGWRRVVYNKRFCAQSVDLTHRTNGHVSNLENLVLKGVPGIC
jgi:hypothetical protein